MSHRFSAASRFICLLAVNLITTIICAQVSIPDANLEAALRQILNQKYGDFYAEDLEPITNLDLAGKNIKYLDGLEYCVNLTDLNAADNLIESLSPLQNLTNLITLDLSNNHIDSVNDLGTLAQLTKLHLEGNPITSITGLFTLGHLNELNLSVGSLIDPNNAVTVLNGLPALTTLRLAGFPVKYQTGGSVKSFAVNDFAAKAMFTKLTELTLPDCQISNLTGLMGLLQNNHNLAILDLSNNSLRDVSQLSGLTGLTQLYLANTEISDITPLSGLTGLLGLSLASNKISDLSPLSNLTQMRILILYNNWISDIGPLNNLTSLQQIYLSYNMVSDLSPISGLETNYGYIALDNNNLDVSSGSAAMGIIQRLESHGYQVVYLPQNVAPAYLWSNTDDLGAGWRYSDWFGVFYDSMQPFIWHFNHGWLYEVGQNQNSIFFYDYGLGTWTWTSQSAYPYFYRFGNLPGWLWYYELTTTPNRWFYNFRTGKVASELSLK